MIIRAATKADFAGLHQLYCELSGDSLVPSGGSGRKHLEKVLEHPGTRILVTDVAAQLTAMATLHVLPNMTQSGRPYALIENVVTLKGHRGRGMARAVMTHARDLAWAQDAYKIMLLTGQHVGARGFYEKLGYSGDEKFAMTLRRVPVRRIG